MAGAFALALPAQAEIKSLDIIAPADPGGGWDQTARAMQAALEERRARLGRQGQEHRRRRRDDRPAQFVSSEARRATPSWSAALVMVGAILTNKSPVTLDDVTPLARLTGEYELIVVPADSPIKTHGRPEPPS